MTKLILVLALCGVATAEVATSECRCSAKIVCLSEQQLADRVERVEMEDDVRGNRVNGQGIAVFNITFDEHGKLVEGKLISGHPIAATHLFNAMPRWRFRPVSVDRRKKQGCGRLSLRFKIVNNESTVEVVKPSE